MNVVRILFVIFFTIKCNVINILTEKIEQDILRFIVNNERHIKYPDASHPNIILVLGNTGVGKSTFVQHITGDNSKLISIEAMNNDTGPTGDYTISDFNERIGSDSIKSHTTIPELMFDVKTNTSIYDCPGFSDNRDAIQDIAGSYFIRNIIDKAAGFKFVFLVEYASVKPGAGKTDFSLLSKHATTLIKNMAKFNGSICLIATKVTDVAKTNVQVTNTIVTYLNSVLKGLQNQTLKTEQDNKMIEFIKVLLPKTNNTYTKIGFMKQPTKAGPLSEMKEVMKHRQSLIKLLYENMKFKKNDGNSLDFDTSISADSLNYVSTLRLEINDQIVHYVNFTIVETIQRYYADSVRDMVTVINGFANDTSRRTSGGDDIAIANIWEAQTFVDEYLRGKTVMEKLAIEIENAATLDDIISKINIEFARLPSNNDTLTTIITGLATFQKFLQQFHKLSRLPTRELSTIFKDAKEYMLKLFSGLHKTVVIVKNRIEGKITSDFSNKEESTVNVGILFHEFDNAHRQIANILKDVETTTSLTTCISQIMNKLKNDSKESILPVYISRYGSYLELLKKLSEISDHINNYSFKCGEGLDVARQHVVSLKAWYSFLSKIFEERLSAYDIQNDIAKYKTVIDEASIDKYENTTLRGSKSTLESFFKLCCKKLYDTDYNDIADIKLDKFKLNALRHIIINTLTNVLEKKFDPDKSELTITGRYIKLKDINRNCTGVKSLRIFALNKIFIDTVWQRTEGDDLVQLSIIAPTWDIYGDDSRIILDGKPGVPPENQKATNGDPGLAGLPGSSAVHFFGFGEECVNAKTNHFILSAIGGKGGPGQDGSDGVNGTINYEDASFELKKERSYGFFKHYNPIATLKKQQFIMEVVGKKEYRAEHFGGGVSYYMDAWEFNFTIFKHGSSGGNGSDGGHGGKGGKPGNVIMTFTNGAPTLKYECAIGETGLSGLGGRRGESGRSSPVFLVTIKDWSSSPTIKSAIETNYIEFLSFYPIDYLNYSPGIAGTDGKSILKMEEPRERPFPYLSHVVNGYKKFLRENLNDKFREADLRKFMNQLQDNKVIGNLYTVSGFVNELLTLEEQYNFLHKTLDVRPFYESLLRRITEYSHTLTTANTTTSDAKNNSTTTVEIRRQSFENHKSLEEKKILSYLYTAILSRICAINIRSNNWFIVDLPSYLDTLSENIKKLKDVSLVEEINNIKNAYNDTIQTKINEAMKFANNVVRELDDIFNQTNNQAQYLIDEITAMKNQSLQEISILQEKKAKLETELVMRTILGITQVVAVATTIFAGPIGTAVAGTIAATSMTAQTFTFDDTGSLGMDKITTLPSAVKNAVSKISEKYSCSHQFIKIQLDIAKAEIDRLNSMELDKPSTASTIKEMKKKMLQLEKEVDEGKYYTFAPQRPKIELADQLKEIKKMVEVEKLRGDRMEAKWKDGCQKVSNALSAVEAGQEAFSRYKNTRAKISQTEFSMDETNRVFIKLQQCEDNIYTVMLPTVRAVEQSMKTLGENLSGQSRTALDIKKWKIQDTIKDLKIEIEKMTEGFKVEKYVMRCIDKLEDAMETVIQIYDRIEEYEERKQFADYIYQINTQKASEIKIQDRELNNDFNKLNVIIHSNYVLIECTKAMNAFLQLMFPFANKYLKQFESLSELRLEKTTVNLVDKATQKIAYITNQMKMNKASNDATQMYMHPIEIFDDEGEHPPPFFVWRSDNNGTLISQLLQGQEITIYSDITNTPIRENAVKFNDIWIRFKLANATLRVQLDEELRKLSIEMTHLGNSYYKCANKIYIINHDSQVIEHAVKTNEKNVYDSPNGMYSNIKAHQPILSPYAFWKMRLFRTKLYEKYDFSTLNKYLNETIEMRLEGYGSYIKSNYTEDVCYDDLDNYYTLHKIISEKDAAQQRNITRRRRYVAENYGEKPMSAKNSAIRL